jgi:hypothetical protein
VLIDDDGVTAVFAHNERAKQVATGIGQMSDLYILWSSAGPMPPGVISVGAVPLCPDHFFNLGKNLTDAGLVVEVMKGIG